MGGRLRPAAARRAACAAAAAVQLRTPMLKPALKSAWLIMPPCTCLPDMFNAPARPLCRWPACPGPAPQCTAAAPHPHSCRTLPPAPAQLRRPPVRKAGCGPPCAAAVRSALWRLPAAAATASLRTRRALHQTRLQQRELPSAAAPSATWRGCSTPQCATFWWCGPAPPSQTGCRAAAGGCAATAGAPQLGFR